MRAVNPAFIPRDHVVEVALDAAVGRQDVHTKTDLTWSALPHQTVLRNASTRLSAGRKHGTDTS